ncbi:unnamed protein product, partial [Candidula unifasciata]
IKETYKSTSNNVLGTRKQPHKEWISSQTMDFIAKRKRIKSLINHTKSERQKDKLMLEYSKLNKMTKKSARADKRIFMENLAETAENATKAHDLQTIHKITQQICGSRNNYHSIPIRDSQGRLLTTEQKQDMQWTKHFSDLLNRPDPLNPSDIQPASQDIDIIT